MTPTPPVTSPLRAHDSTERINLKIEPLDTRHVIRFELDDAILDVIRTMLPTVGGIAPLFASLENKLMAFTDELLAKIADAKQASIDEHTEVLAAVDALKSQLGDVVTPDNKAAVFAAVDDLKAGIMAVFTPDVPPAPAPVPTP